MLSEGPPSDPESPVLGHARLDSQPGPEHREVRWQYAVRGSPDRGWLVDHSRCGHRHAGAWSFFVESGEWLADQGRHLPDARALGPHPGDSLLRADLPAREPLHDLGQSYARDEHRPHRT